MLDDSRKLNEEKSKLETVLIKLENDKEEIKSNANILREHKIEIVRQYLGIIKSYEKALDLLSV